MTLSHAGRAPTASEPVLCQVSYYTYNYYVNRPISKILTALESIYLVPKLIKLSRYYIIYIARGYYCEVIIVGVFKFLIEALAK